MKLIKRDNSAHARTGQNINQYFGRFDILSDTVLNGGDSRWHEATELSVYRQEEPDAMALELNMRPQKRFDFTCPIEMMSELMVKHHEALPSVC